MRQVQYVYGAAVCRRGNGAAAPPLVPPRIDCIEYDISHYVCKSIGRQPVQKLAATLLHSMLPAELDQAHGHPHEQPSRADQSDSVDYM